MPETTNTQTDQTRRQKRRGPFIGGYVEEPIYQAARRLAGADGVPVNTLLRSLITAEAARRQQRAALEQRRAALEAEIAALN